MATCRLTGNGNTLFCSCTHSLTYSADTVKRGDSREMQTLGSPRALGPQGAHGAPRGPMGTHGDPRCSIGTLGAPRGSMGPLGAPWGPVGTHGTPKGPVGPQVHCDGCGTENEPPTENYTFGKIAPRGHPWAPKGARSHSSGPVAQRTHPREKAGYPRKWVASLSFLLDRTICGNRSLHVIRAGATASEVSVPDWCFFEHWQIDCCN